METSVELNDGANYPFNSHEAYADCVEADMREMILSARGSMPPWMVQISVPNIFRGFQSRKAF